METLRTIELDGKQIVAGLDEQMRDPEATKAKALEMLQKSEIHKKYMKETGEIRDTKEALQKEIHTAIVKVRKVEKELKLHTYPPGMRVSIAAQESKAAVGKYLKVLRDLGIIQQKAADSVTPLVEKFQVLTSEVNKEHQKLRNENTVYFEPRAGEIIPKPKQLEKIKKAIKTLKPDELITTKGEKIKKPEVQKE